MDGRFLTHTRRWWLQQLVFIPVGWILALWFVCWLTDTPMTAKLAWLCWFGGLAYKFTEWLITIGNRVDE
jgi:hypothetical protein